MNIQFHASFCRGAGYDPGIIFVGYEVGAAAEGVFECVDDEIVVRVVPETQVEPQVAGFGGAGLVEDCDCSGGCVGGFGAVVQGGVEEDAGLGGREEEGEEGGEAVVHFCVLDEEVFCGWLLFFERKWVGSNGHDREVALCYS